MADNNSSAEKRLLETIEGEQDKPIVKSVRVKTKELGVSALRSRFSFLKDNFANIFKERKFIFDVNTINKGLILVLIMIFLWGGSAYFNGVKLLNTKVLFTPEELKGKATHTDNLKQKDFSRLSEVSSYTDKVLKRNIFERPEQQQTDAVSIAANKNTIENLVKDIKLVGISWDQAKDGGGIIVMLEDTKKNLTFFLKEGDKLSNLVIKKIYKDRVILSYNEEQYELR